MEPQGVHLSAIKATTSEVSPQDRVICLAFIPGRNRKGDVAAIYRRRLHVPGLRLGKNPTTTIIVTLIEKATVAEFSEDFAWVARMRPAPGEKRHRITGLKTQVGIRANVNGAMTAPALSVTNRPAKGVRDASDLGRVH
jgi:hypothetical protein